MEERACHQGSPQAPCRAGQEDFQHRLVLAGRPSLLFSNGGGGSQPAHQSRSSMQGPLSAEAGRKWLQTSTARLGAPAPHTTTAGSPRRRFQHCVGWSKTAKQFQGVSIGFSGLQCNCKIKETGERGLERLPKHAWACVALQMRASGR